MGLFGVGLDFGGGLDFGAVTIPGPFGLIGLVGLDLDGATLPGPVPLPPLSG